MTIKYGKHLERTSSGQFILHGDIPNETIDAHVHIGAPLHLPLKVGFTLTGPSHFWGNLTKHIEQLWTYKNHIIQEFSEDFFLALDDLFDVALFKTEIKGPEIQPFYLLTSIERLFDPGKPAYLKPLCWPDINMIKDIISIYLNYFNTLKQANIETILSYLNTYHINKAIILPIETGRFTQFSDETLKVCHEKTQCIPFCSIHPRHPEAENKIKIDKNKGAKGVKFHPEYQGIAPDSKEAFKLFELCDHNQLPVQCHVGWPIKAIGMAQPERYADAIKTYNQVQFILSHIGMASWDKTIDIAKKFDNVFLETSGQTVDVIRKAAQSIGIERIIFGSDWPLYHPAVPISRILEAFPHSSDQEKVFYQNVTSLIHEK